MMYKPKATMIITQYCECINYEPKSTKGVIDSRCKHCGKMKKPIIIGPGYNRKK